MTARSGSVKERPSASAELGELIDDLAARMQSGEAVDLEAVLAEHPDRADELRQLLPALQLLADVASSGGLARAGGAVAGTLGDFRLIREVGRGGMGIVYEAEQISLNRRVALKVLPFAATMDPRQLQRFRNEAQAAACLHHANIVPVHGVGCERAVHFYAMQLIEGQTLAQVIAESCGERVLAPGLPLPKNRETEARETAPIAALSTKRDKTHYRHIAEVIADAADALEYAHSMGVIHRDIKPGNLMLDNEGHLWITDFGLAKLLNPGVHGGEITMTGDLVGTLRYMSPEQALAKHGLVDHRTDIYSLGATLYELLTLKPAVRGDDKAEILKAIAWEEPTPLRKLDKSIAAELETITLKCLAKEPGERYVTASELVGDLRRFLCHEPIRARPTGRVEKSVKWAKRRPALAALIAVSMLALVALLGAGVYYNGLLQVERSQVRQQAGDLDAAEAEVTRKDAVLSRMRGEAIDNLATSHMLLAQHRWRTGDSLGTLQALDRVPVDHRYWEWDYLQRRSLGSYMTFWGHTRGIWAVAFSPDGKRLASAGGDHMVKVWDAETGSVVQTLSGHTERVVDVAFSPDGRWLASASDDFTVRVWDTSSGRNRHTLRGGPRALHGFRGIAFSPDGQWLAAIGGDGFVRLWDVVAGSLHYAFEVSPVALGGALAFSPDGQRLAAGLFSGVTVWDVSSRAVVQTLALRSSRSVAFSPDRRWLAVGLASGTLSVADAQTGEIVHSINAHADQILRVAFSPDGQRLASCGQDKMVRVWDPKTGQTICTLPGHTNYVTGVAFSPDDQRLASSGVDQTVKVWNARTWTIELMVRGHPDEVFSIAFSRNGRRLVSIGRDTIVKLWDPRTGQVIHSITRNDVVGSGVALSPDGLRVAFPDDDHSPKQESEVVVRRCDLAGGKAAPGLPIRSCDIRGATLSPDGRWLAGPSSDSAAKVWNLKTGEVACALDVSSPRYWRFAFSPNGRHLAGGSANNHVCVWDARTGSVIRELAGHTAPILAVAFSPDGRRLASGGEDCTARVWDAGSGEPIRAFAGHTTKISCVAMSPDGRRLACGTWDYKLKVWNVETGELVYNHVGHSGSVFAVTFSPDGQLLVSGGGGSIRVWDAETGTLRHTLRLSDRLPMISCLALSADGQRVAGGNSNQAIRVWDLQSGQPVQDIIGQGRDEQCRFAFTADGKGLVIADGTFFRFDDRHKSVRVWDVRMGKYLSCLASHTKTITCSAFSPDGRRLATGSVDHTAKVWDVESGELLLTLTGHAETVSQVAFSLDGRHLVSSDRQGAIRIWAAVTGAPVATVPVLDSGESNLALSPDGRWLARWGSNFEIIDARSGRIVQSFPAILRRGIGSLAFSPDGTRLVSGGADGALRFWDTRTGQPVFALDAQTNGARCLAFNPEDHSLVSGGADGHFQAWPVQATQTLRLFESQIENIRVAMSHDGERLAAGGRGGRTVVFNARDSSVAHTLETHQKFIQCLAFSPDGRWLAVGDWDSVIKLWDLQTGTILNTLVGHQAPVTSLAFGPDGQQIASRDRRGQVKTWGLKTGQELPDLPAPEWLTSDGSESRSRDGHWLAVPHDNGTILLVRPLSSDEIEISYREAIARSDPDWQWERAQECRKGNLWFAAAFHCEQVLKARPADSEATRLMADARKSMANAVTAPTPPN